MRKAAAALSGWALLLAAACTSVPSSGDPVVIGPAPLAGAPAEEADIGRRAGAPIKPGASPTEVVAGFLDAEADTSTDGTVVAQQYLTSESVWNAIGETLVYTAADVQVAATPTATVNQIRVTYSLIARINSDGEYRPDVRQAVHTFDVAFIANAGWRISALPRGRRIDIDDLSQVFNRVVPYFYTTNDYDTLVPEPIYQLKQGTKRVFTLVSRLVEGPTPVLRDFLPDTLFPPGTKLLTAPEPENKIAELTFNDALNDARFSDRPRIVAQIVWTLTALDNRITAVTVKVDGRPFVLGADAEAESQRQSQWAVYDPDAKYAERLGYFNLRGGLGLYRTSFVRPGRSLSPGAGHPAVDPTGTTVAVVAPDGLLHELLVGPVATGALVAQLKYESLTKPSWGTKEDGAWVVAQDGEQPPRLYTVPDDAREPRYVPAAELTGRVHAFEVAPDGLRVAAIVERDGRRVLDVGVIDRPLFDRTARRVAGFRPVVNGGDVTPLAVAWLDSGKLAVVGQFGTEDPEIFTVLVDGTDLQPLDPATSKRSQRILQSSRSQGLTEFQLIPLPFEHDDARRGSDSTPDELMLVIDTDKVHVHRGVAWSQMATPAASR